MTEITTERAITVLKNLRKRLEVYKISVNKRRSWRPSEKAMAAAAYIEEMRAVDLAILRMEIELTDKRLKEQNEQKPSA